MDQFEAIRMFVRVVDSGSFSAVAREAGIGQPAVSKQIAALEVRLGAQLLRRTSRKLSVTEAGQEFFARFPDIVVEILVTDRTVDLVQEGVDVAIHNGPLDDSTAVARKIAAT